jgi:hypothetical protein
LPAGDGGPGAIEARSAGQAINLRARLADQVRRFFGVGLLDGLSRRRFEGEPWAMIL